MIDGDFVPVSQLGPDFLILASPFDHPAGGARLILKVDQAERQWDVYLLKCVPHVRYFQSIVVF